MTSGEFTLDLRLAGDTAAVCDWKLSRVLLMNDRRFPWLVLVPRSANVVEPFDLSSAEQGLLWREVMAASGVLKLETGCTKINIGALGNIVAQLHVHVVARGEGDAAWPGPVWGSGSAERFNDDELKAQVARFKLLLRAPD